MSERADTKTIALKKPIEGPAGPINDFTVREPTAGEMTQWDKLTGAEADVLAVSVVAGLPKSVVEKLPARPFMEAARFIASFLD